MELGSVPSWELFLSVPKVGEIRQDEVLGHGLV